MTTHLILGAQGVVGRETAAALRADGRTVSTIALSAARSAESDARPVVLADLRNADSTTRAMAGADVAYLTVGLPYSTRVWQRDWPSIMRNTIDACLAHGTRLVYFDNVYVYGRVNAPMTEATPVRPSSPKGVVRAQLLEMLESAARDRGLIYAIGRSADFYGPGATNSVFNMFVIDNVIKGKAAVWLFNSHLPHSMTYTPDIGRALATIGTDERAWGRTWHVPTAPALTGVEYLELATGGKLPSKTMSMVAMRMGSIFVSAAREALPMAYQNTAPYVFHSTAFEATFGISPTPYRDGIAAAIRAAELIFRH